MGGMRGKVALVTRAGADIGRAVALRLAQEGAGLIVAAVNEVAGREPGRRIKADAGRAAFVFADVVASAEQRFGGLDVLVNNAGGAPEPYFPEAEPEHWGRTPDVSLRGVMLGIQFGIRAMRERGAIVNISSMAGVGYGSYDAPEYAAGKAGVVRLTAALAHLK